ncbi:short transient receptor potential channel 7 [Aplysia californica]|uniref:Short transient receptor potential channel 7 n=1 Tax=Aplysia californica TaxID=6500 RepID=A0ABM1VUU3_APLCA|nr:short transient receptor potential channel 7 [Aplysia californica]
MAAFHLSGKFRRLSEIEGEYKQIYNQLDHQVQNFTLALLDQCQSSDEVKAVLSGKPKQTEEKPDSADSEPYNKGGDILPLVFTALRMEQKKFVAHPQCQAQIGEMWYSGVPFLRYLNRFGYLMLAIPIGLICCPCLSLAYLVSPWSKVSRIVNTPLMKFLSYTCSYLSFLMLIVVAKLYLRHYFDSLACDHPETWAYLIVTVIFMWIVGLIFEECKQIFSAGAKDYFASFWNIMDSIMLSLLLASFVLELVTPIRLNQAEPYDEGGGATTPGAPVFQNYQPPGPAPNSSTMLSMLLQASGSSTPSPLTHIRGMVCQQAREAAAKSESNFCIHPTGGDFEVVWEPAWVPDPQLLSDVLFSLGIIFSISRFSFIMPANEALGCMLVSFRRTVSDIVKVFGMFILLLLAFTCGIAALYAPNRCLTDHFGSFSSTISTLTWSMFGMGSVSVPSLNDYEGENVPVYSLTNHPGKSTGASTVGHYLYGIYVFCTMVVLLNLLIAVMSNTFQEVQDERDVEWKFARTELWLTFIEPGTPVPPPFNIVPSPRHVWKLIMWMCRRSKFRHLLPHEGKKVRYVAVQVPEKPTGSDMEMQDMEDKSTDSSLEGRYTRNDVMCLLIRRYVRHLERVKIEGEDGEKTSNEEMLRRLIERMSSKVEKRLDDLQSKVFRLESEVGVVRKDGLQSQELNKDHFEKFIEFSGRKSSEAERYAFLLDEAKLQILARMDSERIQMERVLEHRVGNLSRRVDESSASLAQQVERLARPAPSTSMNKYYERGMYEGLVFS